MLGLFAFQDPVPEQGKPDPQKSETTVHKVIEIWDDKRATTATKTFAKALKGRPSMRTRSKALEQLATGSNKNLVKPLAKIIEQDKSIVIRKRAAELLGNQPTKAVNKPIIKLLRSGKVTSYPVVHAEVILALSKSCYQAKLWKEIEDEFERYYELERVPLQEALLELITTHKEKQAIPILLRNLDEPAPADVDDPSNPPAEYWEARWKSWRVWRDKVKEALFAITGQRFSTAAEAKAWLAKNKLK